MFVERKHMKVYKVTVCIKKRVDWYEQRMCSRLTLAITTHHVVQYIVKKVVVCCIIHVRNT